MLSFWDKLVKRASLRALKTLDDDENYVFVRQNRLFKDLSAEAFLYVMNSMVERNYKLGETVFREGNPGVCLFLVKSGRVEIFSKADASTQETDTVFSVIGEGTLFGEISIISMAYRTSSAKALDRDTQLLTMSTYDVEELLNQYPRDGLKVLRGITDSIISHLLSTDQRLRDACRQIKELKEKLAQHE